MADEAHQATQLMRLHAYLAPDEAHQATKKQRTNAGQSKKELGERYKLSGKCKKQKGKRSNVHSHACKTAAVQLRRHQGHLMAVSDEPDVLQLRVLASLSSTNCRRFPGCI